LIPIECGFVRVPRIRVVDKRNQTLITSTDPEQPPATEEEGIPVRIFDFHRDERVDVDDTDEAQEDTPDEVDMGSIGPILVLP
jgi:trafficking protein particle complex subunit 11